jgi:hypothetical protein
VAEREKADLLHDAASLARSDWMLAGGGARSVNLPFVSKLDSWPISATEASRPSSAIVARWIGSAGPAPGPSLEQGGLEWCLAAGKGGGDVGVDGFGRDQPC